MNTKLFDIRTTVAVASYTFDPVIITASKAIRNRIWEIVVNDHFNPGVAHYHGQATTITLSPYPGYEGKLVIQMAFAAACLAQVEDFTILFDKPVRQLLLDRNLQSMPLARRFEVNWETIAAFQERYVASMATKTLQRMIGDLNGLGFYANAIGDLNDEAQAALRRLKFSGNVTPIEIEVIKVLAKQIANIEERVLYLYELEIASQRFLAREVDGFAAEIKVFGPIPVLVAAYKTLYTKLAAKAADFQRDVDSFTDPWNQFQRLMAELRQNTPPAAPAAKK